jgi:hypothetical protein
MRQLSYGLAINEALHQMIASDESVFLIVEDKESGKQAKFYFRGLTPFLPSLTINPSRCNMETLNDDRFHFKKTSLFRKDRCNMETLNDDRKIKDLFKQAIIEAIEEKKEVVHDLLFEVMEDIAMVRAIQDGENSAPVSRDDIFQILEGKEGSA